MANSQKLAIFLFFTTIPAIMSLKCYVGIGGTNLAASDLQECQAEVHTACAILISMKYHSFFI